MQFWQKFPEIDKLKKFAAGSEQLFDVNAHLHTPYSFSAFESVEEACLLAKQEDVKIIGINDFYTTAGYEEWAERCTENKIFPLFNIEFVGLSEIEQNNGTLINDPSNPGRIYISGKGLNYPFTLEEPYRSELDQLKERSNAQVKAMCQALNVHLSRINNMIVLSAKDILREHTLGMIRERHLAKALRIEVFNLEQENEKRVQLLKRIFEGNPPKANMADVEAVENEIRSRLLKAGGVAFIPEAPDFFLSLGKIRELILQAGGIPTYPLLADSVNGGFTKFEEDKEELLTVLKKKGFYSVEFIPNRNSAEVLEQYANFFVENGFLVSFGTEHNTPEMLSLRVKTADNKELSDNLRKINYEGACIIAAHQYLKARSGTGFLDSEGTPVSEDHKSFIELGKRIIHQFVS